MRFTEIFPVGFGAFWNEDVVVMYTWSERKLGG